MSGGADPFDWSGGHPALDLVNTLDERPLPSPIERLVDYRDLTRFVVLAGLIDKRTANELQRRHSRSGAPIVKRARRLRENFHDLLAATVAGRAVRQADLDALSVAIRSAHAARTLVASPFPVLMSHRWAPALAPEIPLHACSLAIERLLTAESRKRIRKCGAPDCAVYYLDTSKGQRRQWCSMDNCGNREKQRRWRCSH